MPKIDLPPDSLGPKPTKKQLETLTMLSKEGVIVHEWSGVRIDWHANVRYGNSFEKFNLKTLHKFVDWGWLEKAGDADDWKSRDWKLSDRGRKVIEKGETRK